MPAFEMLMDISGDRMRLTPPASAIFDSPLRRTLTGEMHSHKRRGTGSIHGHAGTMQPEEIGKSPSRGIECVSRYTIGIDLLQMLTRVLDLHIIIYGDTYEYPGLTTFLIFRVLSRLFERRPTDFKQQPLLRIHTARFARRNAEKLSVKLIHIP